MRKTYSRQFWVIVKYRTGGMEVLRITLTSGEEALPVFSFEDEAGMFLALGALRDGWRVRDTTAGELTSLLFGAGVGRVVLDPLPGPFVQALMDLASIGRRAFMESYLKNEETLPLTAGSRHRRQGDMGVQGATLEKG